MTFSNAHMLLNRSVLARAAVPNLTSEGTFAAGAIGMKVARPSFSSPDEAGLILKVVQTGELNMSTGAGNQATVLLPDRTSGTELWSKTKGGSWAMSGWNNAWVARALAKEFIKFFDSTATTK